MIRCLLALILVLPAARALDFSPLAPIPIQESGRKKPYLVFAEESLMSLSGKAKVEVDGQKKSALEVVSTLWLSPEGWNAKPLILVNHRDLKKTLGLDEQRKLFSYDELVANQGLRKLLSDAQAQRAKPGAPRLTGLPKEASDVGMRLAEFESLANGSAFRFVANPAGAGEAWIAVPGSDPSLGALREAFQKNDDAAFRQAAEALRLKWAAIEPQFQPTPWKISLETLYQQTHPFRWAWILYGAAGLTLIFGGRGTTGYTLAWIFALGGFLFQASGFAARVLIGGRAPVTNMYESVVWVAFGTILFALIFEAIYRSRFFLLGAAPIAVISLILADTQTLALDRSIHPLVPVLRDNFWLTTHVLSITLSYAAFALALGVGHIVLGYVIAHQKPGAALYNYLYRTLQVGVLFLAVGTILGGVWANYSWGRFWDWDPKETWALITLLGYLFVLHGRIAGSWGGFGLAVGAVLAFQGVLMAWYGVNYVLGVGLHSYGFGVGGFGWALGFVAVELAFVALAILRHRQMKPAAAGREKKADLQPTA